MLILGVDPGTAVTGYGLVRLGERATPRLVECGVIRTRPQDALVHRLLEISTALRAIIDRCQPEVMAVEDIFYARNVRTTVVLGHARGVIMLAGAQAGLDVHEFPPAEIKKAVTGTGNATKEQVQFMVARLLRLAAPPSPADAADAVAVALTLSMRVHLLVPRETRQSSVRAAC
ncbi:MAG: crossover junction endodeoxyribonuclease RuvC [Gemmatimonadetes bacterium]|nr:crossover junction endodeoxyribonuclease RuvC [Gemmatimonadota bacterium]